MMHTLDTNQTTVGEEKDLSHQRVPAPRIHHAFFCINLFSPCLVRWQALAADPSVAPFVCGAAVADAPVGPGGTWRGTLTVDDSVCPDPVYTVVSMLGEYCTGPLIRN